jgi:hypothetical protein
MSVYELSAREIYETYVGYQVPPDLLTEGREEIATRLRVEEGLRQEEAYYAADQILAYIRGLAGTEEA